MTRVSFVTLGCRLNQCETQRLAERFHAAGFAVVPAGREADVVVVNSCQVTGVAESKSRAALRRMRRLHPEALIVLTGCAGQAALNRGEPCDGADLVIPNPEKEQALEWVLRARPDLARGLTPPREAPASLFGGRTRALVKIQDGCSIGCSFCSIPMTRPGLRSRSVAEVEDEVRTLVERGYREVVLTGVLIGAYGSDSGASGLPALIRKMNRIEGLLRLRLSSIEPTHVSEEIVDLLAEGSLMPHLHIPLQSADDRVLEAMHRPYRSADYARLVERLLRAVPDMTLTTDVMVGFPAETEDAFSETLAFCRAQAFAGLHVFRYSPRPGTAAAVWGDPVPPEEKARRSEALRRLAGELRARAIHRFLGRTFPVLVEGSRRGGLFEGHTPNFLPVRFVGSPDWRGEVVPIRLEGEVEGEAIGVARVGEISDSGPEIGLSP